MTNNDNEKRTGNRISTTRLSLQNDGPASVEPVSLNSQFIKLYSKDSRPRPPEPFDEQLGASQLFPYWLELPNLGIDAFSVSRFVM